MKITIAIAIVLLTAAATHAYQFGGEAPGVTIQDGVRIRTGNTIVLYFPIDDPLWSYDVETDGFSLDINEVTVSWSATGLEINPFDSIDITFTAPAFQESIAITPTATTIWSLARASMIDMSVSGTFYGFGGVEESFGGSLSVGADFANFIELNQFPDSVSLRASSQPNQSLEIEWTGGTDKIEFGQYRIDSITLATPIDPILVRIPEPTTCTLALAALCLAMSRRRSH